MLDAGGSVVVVVVVAVGFEGIQNERQQTSNQICREHKCGGTSKYGICQVCLAQRTKAWLVPDSRNFPNSPLHRSGGHPN